MAWTRLPPEWAITRRFPKPCRFSTKRCKTSHFGSPYLAGSPCSYTCAGSREMLAFVQALLFVSCYLCGSFSHARSSVTTSVNMEEESRESGKEPEDSVCGSRSFFKAVGNRQSSFSFISLKRAEVSARFPFGAVRKSQRTRVGPSKLTKVTCARISQTSCNFRGRLISRVF